MTDERHEDEADLGVEISPADLAPETLRRLVEEVATRDGTDYGEVETPLETRVRQLMAQLDRGEARIVWSAQTETINIVHQRELEVTTGRKPQR